MTPNKQCLSAMTLEQLRDDIRDVYYSAPDQLTEAIVCTKRLLRWKHVVEAALAERKAEKGEAVAWRYRFLGEPNKWLYANTGEELVDKRPLIEAQPLYIHPLKQREVTDEDVIHAIIEYRKIAALEQVDPGFIRDSELYDVTRRAMRNALSSLQEPKK